MDGRGTRTSVSWEVTGRDFVTVADSLRQEARLRFGARNQDMD
jgi:hypothetical protein